jgi:hypothetical protein
LLFVSSCNWLCCGGPAAPRLAFGRPWRPFLAGANEACCCFCFLLLFLPCFWSGLLLLLLLFHYCCLCLLALGSAAAAPPLPVSPLAGHGDLVGDCDSLLRWSITPCKLPRARARDFYLVLDANSARSPVLLIFLVIPADHGICYKILDFLMGALYLTIHLNYAIRQMLEPILRLSIEIPM